MKLRLAVLAAVASIAAPALAAPAVHSYHVAGTIAGPDGGWDYTRVDPVTHRLYVARTSSVTVIDTAAAKALTSIGVIAHGHAVLPISGGRVLVTSGDDATVRFLRVSDGKELARLAVGKKPDAAILSDDGRRAFAMNAHAGSVSVIDVAAMTVERTIPLKPGLEYAALTPTGTLFVNNEDANEIDVVDLANGTAQAPVALPGCTSPSGLAFDAKTDRLIAACANGKAAIVDAGQRRLVALVDIGLGPDAVILDAARRLAFIPCGKDGVLDILSLDGPAIQRSARVTTEVGARTGALDPTSGTIYLPTARFTPAATVGARPVANPGSFHVVIVRRS